MRKLIRVNFSDNDFVKWIEQACDLILDDSCDYGRNSWVELTKNLSQLEEKITITAFGLYIAYIATTDRLTSINNILDEDNLHTLNYLRKNIKISLVDEVFIYDNNYEVIYIDCDNLNCFAK